MSVSRPGIRLAGALVLSCLMVSSCLVRRRTVVPAGKALNKPSLTATKEDLIARVHAIADPIRSFQMKVDMSPSIGNLYGGQVTDYATIAGIIFFRRPKDIRVIGLDPVIHGTAFDMLSLGNEFQVSIPPKNQFIRGRDDSPANSPNKLENLRPSAFSVSLLIEPPDPGEITILADDTDETKSVYILMFVHRDGDTFTLHRNLYFDRKTLTINRQKTFNPEGYITSLTLYSDWQSFSGVSFPTVIDIQRPQDGYELNLKVTDLKMNGTGALDDKMKLVQPPGAEVKILN